MANMFSNKTEKKIPKTLNDCVKPDATVANLHTWAERLESWGKFLFKALIVIGIISTIFDAVEVSDVDEELILGAIITSATSWALYAFIEYCAYHVLALLVSALASITQNSIISANVALLEASQHHEYIETPTTQNVNMPKSAPKPAPRKNIPDGHKACWACGHVQPKSNMSCSKCGEVL